MYIPLGSVAEMLGNGYKFDSVKKAMYIYPINSRQLLVENFNSPNRNWNLESGWSFAKIGNNSVLQGIGHKWARFTNTDFMNYSAKLKFKIITGDIHLNVRQMESSNGLYRYMVTLNKNALGLVKQESEKFTNLIDTPIDLDNNWHNIEIKVNDGIINVLVDDDPYIIYKDTNYIQNGILAFETLDDSEFFIDDVEIKALTSKDVLTKLPDLKLHNQKVRGVLTRNQVWSGEIQVTGEVIVPEGITLTIEPGTIVKFNTNTDYKNLNKFGLVVAGGKLLASGTATKQIWFTSGLNNPTNGDWSGIRLNNTTDSKIDYVIVEYGQMGIEQYDSGITVSNSIIRWSNAEGLYAERSSPKFINNTIYGNGYHEIALEQHNKNVKILNNTIKDGNFGVHLEKTSAEIEGNYFSNERHNAITMGMESTAVIKDNKFFKIGEKEILVYGGSAAEEKNNDFENGNVKTPVYDYKDIKRYELGYIPGDAEDRFSYVYDDEDDTRKVIKKIGKDLSFGWALAYADNYLWRFSLGNGTIGTNLDFIRIDPNTGEYVKYGNDIIMNPRGLTFDGEFFWVNDFSLLKIYKFKLEGNFIKIYDSFDIPDKELGGTMGLTSDNTYLYLRSRDGSKIYKLDKQGNKISEIIFKNSSIGNSIVWTGEHFWVSGGSQKGIGKYSIDGTLVGEIYPAAEGTWALTWDGKYLWALQRTCENWNDPKIYQLEIKNDALTNN